MKIVGWFASITVDGTAYQLSGVAGGVNGLNEPVQQAVTFTPTSTIFSMKAGPMNVNLTYLSPIEVRPLIRAEIECLPTSIAAK